MPFLPFHIEKRRARLIFLVILLAALAGGFFDYPQAWDKLATRSHLTLPPFPSRPYQFGLDIAGGTSLTYRADLSNVDPKNYTDAMAGLRDVIERRVNLFGVKEPRVEVARSAGEWRLLVELAGITNVNEAIKLIGETPFLEFREERSASDTAAILAAQKTGNPVALQEDPYFQPTPLTGKYLSSAALGFDNTTYQPLVQLQFNADGTKLFADITERNVGKRVAIYLDGAPISTPVVQEAIPSGAAQITGHFTVDEANQLVRRLNEGALPVPITLISQHSVGAIFGRAALLKSLRAGVLGFILVALFMILFYRLSGLVAIAALLVYASFVLVIFKVIPVTLTLAGIAGFILSVGMAVDANILIFERTKEELRKGKLLSVALQEGFSRAWPSIRDSNVSTIITSIVLYTFATSIVQGFALTLLIGVLLSMFSAIFVSRTILLLLLPGGETTATKWWFGTKRLVEKSEA